MGPARGEEPRGAGLASVASPEFWKMGAEFSKLKLSLNYPPFSHKNGPARGGPFLASPNHLILYETLLRGCPGHIGRPTDCCLSYDLIMA